MNTFDLLKEIAHNALVQQVLKDESVGVAMDFDPIKGRIVRATSRFEKGSYVLTYAGKIISSKEGYAKDQQYEHDDSIGSYLFFFPWGPVTKCVDATEEIEGNKSGEVVLFSV